MLEAARVVHARHGARLTLVGPFQPPELQARLAEPGVADASTTSASPRRTRRASWSVRARVGLLLLLGIKAYEDTLPTKIFEYMAEGLPVIASDVPLWKEFLDDTGAGVVVPADDGAAAGRGRLPAARRPGCGRGHGRARPPDRHRAVLLGHRGGDPARAVRQPRTIRVPPMNPSADRALRRGERPAGRPAAGRCAPRRRRDRARLRGGAGPALRGRTGPVPAVRARRLRPPAALHRRRLGRCGPGEPSTRARCPAGPGRPRDPRGAVGRSLRPRSSSPCSCGSVG